MKQIMFTIIIIMTLLVNTSLIFFEDKIELIKIVYNSSADSTAYTIKANGLYIIPADLYYTPSDEDANFYNAILDCITEYNSKAPKPLFSGNIIQDDSIIIETIPRDVDYKNELVFGDLGETGTIAMANVWVTRLSRLIVDFDIVLNTHYNWGNLDDTSYESYFGEYIDTESIISHELGHGVGLGDLYENEYYWQTMYGYACWGETWKRTLEEGDVAGLYVIYGTTVDSN